MPKITAKQTNIWNLCFPQNLLLSIPLLFISTFLFQLIYFLATLYPQETSLEFFILGVLLIFICIIFYQTLNDQLKKIQIASQFSMLQKQHHMEQEQMDHLHFRTDYFDSIVLLKFL